ncbi:FCD domain-containing protein [Pontivivens insulae]|uniref:Pyruvate dehydrogenase complex repressor n=1 Tax=Pontivivens insulae TaxID=1639689 RepID=A0A2R8ABI6_9RHOB|nr:FCD domain-containing protein [Pontivivens insulae]RED11246.1 GntR family transcriptional regulator [Pontivivens insulae]SPF29581.1 Pyruvate dehydrogenase complex repressor [Pontivivens insulae]
MPFQKIETERVADAIIHQIESLILRGVLQPGERLPSERDLASRLGASRPSLREALAQLEENGLIVTRAGSGAYVAEVLGSAFAPPLIQLFASHEEAFFDYLSFRRDLEGMAAERAARFATPTDLAVIRAVFERMEAAHGERNPDHEATLDAEFHMAIVEAAHNVVMMHMMRSMFDLLRNGVFYNRQILFGVRDTRTILLGHHRAIHDAIQMRDPSGARKALEDHLMFIEDSMREHVRRTAQEDTARLRLAQIETG